MTREEVTNSQFGLNDFDGDFPEPSYKPGDKIPDDIDIYNTKSDQELWSGSDLVSLILPKINLTKGQTWFLKILMILNEKTKSKSCN